MIYRLRLSIAYFLFAGSIISPCFSQAPRDSTEGTPETVQKRSSIKYWWEFYDESMILHRERDNINSLSHTRQGIKLPLSSTLSVETYLFLRYGKDLHKDFWNNKFEAGLGARLRFSKKFFLAFFLESIQGSYLNISESYYKPDRKRYNDFRSGFIFWYGWDKYPSTSRWVSFPLNSWGDIYSDIIYYRKEKKNLIAYIQARSGLRLFQFWKSTLDGYGILYLIKDRNNDFWNNLVEYGTGFWIKPYPDLDLKLFVEWLHGTYFGIESVDPNPYSQHYRDRRIGILFWIGW